MREDFAERPAQTALLTVKALYLQAAIHPPSQLQVQSADGFAGGARSLLRIAAAAARGDTEAAALAGEVRLIVEVQRL